MLQKFFYWLRIPQRRGRNEEPEEVKLRKKGADKKAKVAAVFEEEALAKRKALKKKSPEELPLVVKEEVLEVDSEETGSD